MRHALTSFALAGALLSTAAAASEPEPQPAPGTTAAAVAAARATLDGIAARIERATRDVQTLRHRAARTRGGDTAPEMAASFERRIERWRRHIDLTLLPLRGRPWTEVEPVLREAQHLRRRLDRLGESLRAPVQPRVTTKGVAAPPAGTGRITGRVVDRLTGLPLAATVEIHDLSGTFLGSFETLTGSYSIDGLSTGTYFLTAESDAGNGYARQLYQDLPCQWFCDVTEGTPVVVLDGEARPGVDFALDPFGLVSGTVIDAASEQPLQAVEMRLYDAQGSLLDFATTAADGTYRFEGVSQGVRFAVAEHRYYLDQLYAALPCQPDCDPPGGTPILVGAGAAVTGIDFRLQQGGSVSGRVTEQTTGDPISSWVDLYASDGSLVDYGRSNAEGWFQIFDLATGVYFARTETGGEYEDELYDDLPCEPSCDPTGGTPIAVTQGQVREGIDFALASAPSGSLSGMVVEAPSGQPITVRVDVVDAVGSWQGWAYSDVGFYRVAGLSTGTHFVYTESEAYVDELYDGFPCDPSCVPTSGTPVTVTAGADTGGIDFDLERGGWVTGQIVSQVGGLPLPGTIYVYRSDGALVRGFSADETGRYLVSGLVTGAYFAVAEGYDFVPELYSELPCATGCDPTTGTPIMVTTARGTTGIDFTLNRLGRIAGRVTEAGTGLPTGILVGAYTAAGDPVASASSDATGRYVLSGLPPGGYFVRTNSWPDQNFVDELYDDRTCEPDCDVTQGTPVTVALDATTGGIDFVLRRPTFADVPVDHWAWRWVEATAAAGVTGGCASSPLRFCPDASVTRAQSSVFLLRAKEGPGYQPPPATGVFADVPATSPFAPWVEELARRGVTGGCGVNPPLFCPATTLTRAQSAPFLLRTLEGSTYVPPPAVGVFQDVPATNAFASWIEELVRRGVTTGCSVQPALFCPQQPLTRAQVAVFLTKTFGLPLP